MTQSKLVKTTSSIEEGMCGLRFRDNTEVSRVEFRMKNESFLSRDSNAAGDPGSIMRVSNASPIRLLFKSRKF